MTYEEYCSWRLYRNLRGPLLLHQRVDRVGALIAVRTGGGKMKDFMPWSGENTDKEKDDISEDKGILLTPETIAAMAESEQRRQKRVALKTKKMVESKEDKKERIERLRSLKNQKIKV